MKAESFAQDTGSSLSAPVRDREAVKAALSREGTTITTWARDHGYSRKTVYKVLGGTLPCHSGVTHNIAVRLGMKDGDINPAAEPAVLDIGHA